jgi:hypothetical protein
MPLLRPVTMPMFASGHHSWAMPSGGGRHQDTASVGSLVATSGHSSYTGCLPGEAHSSPRAQVHTPSTSQRTGITANFHLLV